MTLAVETARNGALLAWYAAHGRRDLPWRGERDPYRVLVSEVMLQQTQASRVVDPYRRFLARFPTAEALAAASLAEVLDAWSGLGYNRRAERLRRVARRVVDEGWPTTPDGLATLPGVGPYTAAAVACFAFGARVPTVDTNLRRVLSRWYGEPLSGAVLEATARRAMAGDATAWNQSVMDLGAMLCRARRPACDRCPVATWCVDPDAYRPPRSQGRFEGSDRQLRGMIVRAAVRGPVSAAELWEETGFAAAAVIDALEALTADGLLVLDVDGRYRVAD